MESSALAAQQELAPRRVRAKGRRPGRRERRLAAALRRRDPDALRLVYADLGPVVLGYLNNALGDRGAAEDVHQQVFLEVWQSAPGYDVRRASLITWIMTIARSRAIDEMRRRRPEPRDPAASAETEDAEDSVDELIERWRVAYLLSRLRPDEALLLRLRFYEGLSQSEIAERSGIALGTVKMRMVAALDRLRELVAAEEAGS